MLDPWIAELIGYVASILVAVSLMMSSIVRLRVINLMGAVTFAIYGMLISAYPVAAVNLFIVFINLYYLRGMMKTDEFFHLLEVPSESDYLHCFMEHYREDIERFMPGWTEQRDVNVFVLRDMVPAGLLAGRQAGATLHVDVDYVIPQFRDFKIGRYLFEEQAAYFRDRGIREIVSPAGTDRHRAYLKRMGFERIDESSYRISV